MSRIVIFGLTEVNLEGINDPSTKVFLVGTNYDYEDDNTVSINDKNILDFYNDEKLETVEEPILFVDCTGHSKDYLDVMYRLRTTRFDKRTYLIGPTANDEQTLIVKDLKFQSHFNPFDGDEIPKSLKESSSIINFFKTCSQIIYYYLRAGFDKKEILEIPPGWTMNIAGKELNLISLYYGLLPIAEDVAPMIDFAQNSQYRQIMLTTLIAITSNFVIRNRFVNIAEVEDWNSVETWKMIQDKF